MPSFLPFKFTLILYKVSKYLYSNSNDFQSDGTDGLNLNILPSFLIPRISVIPVL